MIISVEQIIEDLIEVEIDPEKFLVIAETLERIGIASKHKKTLYQSCHILHKRGKYYCTHFKQLFMLDQKETDFTEEDRARLNTIANILSNWGLIKIKNPTKTANPTIQMNQIKIISHRERKEWQLCAKYSIGKKK